MASYKVLSAISGIGYAFVLKNATTNEELAYCSTQYAPGYNLFGNLVCVVNITKESQIDLIASVNYLNGKSSAGTANGYINIMKLV